MAALAAYAGTAWDSMHLRVLAREIAIAAVVCSVVDSYVLDVGPLRADGTLQPVLDRRLGWGGSLRKNIAMFEELVRAQKPSAGHLDLVNQLQAETQRLVTGK
jgi:hypothetical protein